MTPSAIVFLFVTGVVIPALAYTSKRQMDRGVVVPKLPFYAEAITLQVLLLAGSFYVAMRSRVLLFRPFRPELSDALLALALLLTALTAAWTGWRMADQATRRRLSMLIPVTLNERIAWVGVSLAAGFAEEVAYRGVMVTILNRALRNWWIAALISSALFALAHLLQGWRSAAVAGVFGFLFHLLVVATGGLYYAILVHFAYDLTAGWRLGQMAPQPGDTTTNDATV
jgi:membrane protease YdiL (CAAX protease family)